MKLKNAVLGLGMLTMADCAFGGPEYRPQLTRQDIPYDDIQAAILSEATQELAYIRASAFEQFPNNSVGSKYLYKTCEDLMNFVRSNGIDSVQYARLSADHMEAKGNCYKTVLNSPKLVSAFSTTDQLELAFQKATTVRGDMQRVEMIFNYCDPMDSVPLSKASPNVVAAKSAYESSAKRDPLTVQLAYNHLLKIKIDCFLDSKDSLPKSLSEKSVFD